MTFELDSYEPVAFHAYPALMRAAEARTEVLHPATPVAAPPVPVAPQVAETQVSQPAVGPVAPASNTSVEPVEAYLVGIGATAVLRRQLADFLDAAGARRDVWVSVGVASGSTVEWLLRSVVPYAVRALPRYPDVEPMTDTPAAIASVAAAVEADLADQPDRRRLLVLIWDRPPAAVRLPTSLASTLLLHCVDAELDRLPPHGWGPCWLLSRSRPRPPRSVLAQAGRLLTGWDTFSEVPGGLVLARLG